MNRKAAGRTITYVGVFLALVWIFQIRTHHGYQPGTSLLFYVVLIFLGLWLAKPPSSRSPRPTVTYSEADLPPGFSANFRHENIALDTTTGRLWLRDGAYSRVFDRREVISWGFESDTMQGLPTQVVGGIVRHGTTVRYNSRIAIQTTDMNHPVYRVVFKRYGDFFHAPKNVADAQAWGERLTAFMNLRS